MCFSLTGETQNTLSVRQHTFKTHTAKKGSGALHVLDVREGKDSSAVKAVGVPTQPVFVGLLLLVLVLFFPVQQLKLVFNSYGNELIYAEKSFT